MALTTHHLGASVPSVKRRLLSLSLVLLVLGPCTSDHGHTCPPPLHETDHAHCGPL